MISINWLNSIALTLPRFKLTIIILLSDKVLLSISEFTVKTWNALLRILHEVLILSAIFNSIGCCFMEFWLVHICHFNSNLWSHSIMTIAIRETLIVSSFKSSCFMVFKRHSTLILLLTLTVDRIGVLVRLGFMSRWFGRLVWLVAALFWCRRRLLTRNVINAISYIF